MGYIAMGPAGCTVGDFQLSGFAYTASASGGAREIATDQIGVTPVLAVPGNVGVLFKAPWGVLAGQSQGSNITYQVTSLSGTVQVQQVGLGGFGFRAGMSSSVTVVEDLAAAAGTYSIDVYLTCTDSCTSQTSSDVLIPATSSLVVEDMVTLQSGQGGATMNRFIDWFVVCPACA